MSRNRGLLPIHSAVIRNDIENLLLLIENDQDTEPRDCHGNVPLHYCSCVEIAHVLLNSGADPFARSYMHFKFMLHLAIDLNS